MSVARVWDGDVQALLSVFADCGRDLCIELGFVRRPTQVVEFRTAHLTLPEVCKAVAVLNAALSHIPGRKRCRKDAGRLLVKPYTSMRVMFGSKEAPLASDFHGGVHHMESDCMLICLEGCVVLEEQEFDAGCFASVGKDSLSKLAWPAEETPIVVALFRDSGIAAGTFKTHGFPAARFAEHILQAKRWRASLYLQAWRAKSDGKKRYRIKLKSTPKPQCALIRQGKGTASHSGDVVPAGTASHSGDVVPGLCVETRPKDVGPEHIAAPVGKVDGGYPPCPTLHRVISLSTAETALNDMMVKSLESFSPEFEQILWCYTKPALLERFANCLWRDAGVIMDKLELKCLLGRGFKLEDVDDIFRLRVLRMFGGWICDDDVLWLGKTLPPLVPVGVRYCVSSIPVRKRTTGGVSPIFFGGIRGADVFLQSALERVPQSASGRGDVVPSRALENALLKFRQSEKHAQAEGCILDIGICCPLPSWIKTWDTRDTMPNAVYMVPSAKQVAEASCMVKIWSSVWPAPLVHQVVQVCLSVRAIHRASPEAGRHRRIVETRLAANQTLDGMKEILITSLGDAALAWEVIGLALQTMKSLHEPILRFAAPWGDQHLACAVVCYALARCSSPGDGAFGSMSTCADMDRQVVHAFFPGALDKASFHMFYKQMLSRLFVKD